MHKDPVPRAGATRPAAAAVTELRASVFDASRSSASTLSSRCSALRVLELRVREAAQALHEEHHRRDAGARDLGRVVQRARRQPVRRARAPRGSPRRRARSASRRRGSARCSRSAPTRPRCSPRRRTARRACCASSSIRASDAGVEMALVEQLLGRLDDRGDDARLARRRRPTCRPRRRRPRPRSRGSSSASFAAPASASRRLSIGVEPACAAWPRQVKRERSTPNVPSTTPSGRSSDSSTGPCSMCSSRYARRVLELRARVERAVELDAVLAQRVGQRDAVAVVQLPQLVLVAHRAGGGRRAEERAAEARALLVGPVDEPHRHRRLALRGDPPQHLDAGEHVQAAVEPAAVRHRVHVPADQQRPVGGARAA